MSKNQELFDRACHHIPKEQTYNFLFHLIDIKKNITKKLKPKTMYKAKCLCCGKDIFVSYAVIKPVHLFCDIHKNEGRKKYLTDGEQLLQSHYMRFIKEQQLKIVENNFNKQYL